MKIKAVMIVWGLLSLFSAFTVASDNPALLTLWYNTPASNWNQALPIGNG